MTISSSDIDALLEKHWLAITCMLEDTCYSMSYALLLPPLEQSLVSFARTVWASPRGKQYFFSTRDGGRLVSWIAKDETMTLGLFVPSHNAEKLAAKINDIFVKVSDAQRGLW